MTNREYRRRYYERIKEILREARKTISNEKRWCKGNMATVGHGVLCDIDDPAACEWCATGALHARYAEVPVRERGFSRRCGRDGRRSQANGFRWRC